MKDNILQRVRKIEIKTRGLSNDIFAGKYHSAFKGRGMAFSEVRDYRIGDDIRDIDWNVTARTQEPHIKIFQEERELTLMLLVDVSASENFGTTERDKKQLTTELAAVMAFSAAQNNDKIGCIMFSDRIEKYIPAKKGRQHVLRIISELLEFKPEGRGTDISKALRFFTSVVKKRCTAFLISDMIDVSDSEVFANANVASLTKNAEESNHNTEKNATKSSSKPKVQHTASSDNRAGQDILLNYQDAIKISALRHDLVVLRIYDQRERELVDVGLMRLLDSETGESRWIDTSSAKVRKAWSENWVLGNKAVSDLMLKNNIDNVEIATDQDYVKALIKLFKTRR